MRPGQMLFSGHWTAWVWAETWTVLMMSTQQNHAGDQEAVKDLREGTQGLRTIILCLHQGRRTGKWSVKIGLRWLVLALGPRSVFANAEDTSIPVPVPTGTLWAPFLLQNDARFPYVLLITEHLTWSSSSFGLYLKRGFLIYFLNLS